MKKLGIIVVVIVIITAAAGGGYVLLHKKSTPAAANTTGSVNNAVVVTKSSANRGQYLADPSGKALYTYSSDTNGVSNCTGSCLANWPAYQDTGTTTGLPAGISTITRTDNGQVQYTYHGLPLYYFVSDPSGQVTGDGIEGFKVATPGSAASTSSNASTSPTNNDTSTDNSSGYTSPSYPY